MRAPWTGSSTLTTTSGDSATCRGSWGRCSRVSSAPTSRSGATTRSRSIRATSRGAASRSRFTCRPTGRLRASGRRGGVGAGGGRPNRLPPRHRGLRRSARPGRGRGAQGAEPVPAAARHPHAAPLARKRAVPLRRRAGCDERCGAAPRRRAADQVRFRFRAAESSPAQMEDGAAFAEAFPDVPMALAHCGMPEDLTPEGWQARGAWAWKGSPPCPASRSSSRGSAPSFIGSMRPISSARCARPSRSSGRKRCLWGSNFPIEKLWTDYASLLDAFRKVAGPLERGGPGADICGHCTAALSAVTGSRSQLANTGNGEDIRQWRSNAC